ncbi:hypothetical protein LguiB_010769 [Lonicera macranthoides]
MESVGGALRWRKHTLKPIDTTRKFRSELLEGDGHPVKGSSGSGEAVQAEEEPLSPAARLFHEPNFNVYIIAIMGSKTRIYPDVVKDKLVHTLLKHPRFSSLQVVDEEKGGAMKWVQTKVNLDNHVIIPNLVPNNIASPDKFVEDYIFDLSKTKIDKSKPMWELHLLNLKTSDAEAVGIFRIHHSLGDGTSLMSLLLACTRQVSNPEALPTIFPSKKKSGGGSGWSASGPWRWLAAVWLGLVLAWNTLVDVVMFIATALYLKDTMTPIKAPPGAEFTPRRIVYRTVSLDDMKLVKNAMNMTINDVALGVTQAGLSRYLNRRYGEEGKDKNDENATEKRNNIPKNIRLRSTLLINIRPSSGIQALADMMEKNAEAKWGNWIGYVLLPFTIGLRDDPLDYVREAKSTIDRKKTSLEAIYTFSIAELVLKFFGIKKASGLSHRIIEHTTICFSNLVGPLEEIGFYGHPMAYLAPSSYGQPHGLMINFQSYINKMTIVVSVDESAIPDPHQLCNDLEESLKLIKDAVLA